MWRSRKGRAAWRASSSYANNGEIIAVGEAYESKAAAKNGIASVHKNAPDATVVD